MGGQERLSGSPDPGSTHTGLPEFITEILFKYQVFFFVSAAGFVVLFMTANENHVSKKEKGIIIVN